MASAADRGLGQHWGAGGAAVAGGASLPSLASEVMRLPSLHKSMRQKRLDPSQKRSFFTESVISKTCLKSDIC